MVVVVVTEMQRNVSKLMSDQKMTICTMVKKTGVSLATTQKARDERIEHCRMGSLKKIADALGVTVQDCFEEIDYLTSNCLFCVRE